VLYIFIVVLDPSSLNSSPQVTEAQNVLLFILARQRNSRTKWAKVQRGMPTFVVSASNCQFTRISKI